MRWTAIIPFNHGAERKTRLAQWLTLDERQHLSLAMARHVAEVVSNHPAVLNTLVIAPTDPQLPRCHWIADEGRGLNAELQAVLDWQKGGVAIFHADLPCLSPTDIDALLNTAGTMVAPDWRDDGTNALAATDPRQLQLHFGKDSFRLHRDAMPDATILRREGFGLDLDTIEDVERLQAVGIQKAFDQWLSPARYRTAPV